WNGNKLATLHGNVYALAGNTLYGSSDEGVAWSALVIPTYAFAVDEEADAIVVSNNTGVIRSFDDGRTWQTLAGLLLPPPVLLAYKGGVLAADLTSIYRYSDTTQSWDHISYFFDVLRIDRVASSPARVLVIALPSNDGPIGLFSVAETGGQEQPIAIDRGNT